MLTEQITDPWMKFRITGKDAKDAFLYVIYAFSAYRCDKKSILDGIISKCPEVRKDLTDAEILQEFEDFYRASVQRREFISPAEFKWISYYVENPDVRENMEEYIYRSLIMSSSPDETRRNFEWSIDENRRKELVRDILKNSDLPFKRKMEIANEFGEPSEQFKNKYFRKLLWDRHYDKAKELGAIEPETVISVIVSNINAGYITDAANIAAQFIPDRKDIAEEIERIRLALQVQALES